MGKPGPKRKSHLQVVKEGNPGKRPVKERAELPPAAPDEPDWSELFPSKPPEKTRRKLDKLERLARSEQEEAAAVDVRCCLVAAQEWRRIVPVLDAQGLLSTVDLTVLRDFCICWARIDMCERDISKNGVWVMGERGQQKNPSTTAANQYRTQLKFYVGELGLSPSSRVEGQGETDGEEDNPYDV